MTKSPDPKNKSVSSRNKPSKGQTATNDSHNHGQAPAAHVQIRVLSTPPPQMLHRTPSGSPPTSLITYKSKAGKSKRFTDPHETAPLDWKDYTWLAIFYVGLYLFFVLFWFACWLVYLMSLPEKGYRYNRNDLMGINEGGGINGNSRSAMVLCNNST